MGGINKEWSVKIVSKIDSKVVHDWQRQRCTSYVQDNGVAGKFRPIKNLNIYLHIKLVAQSIVLKTKRDNIDSIFEEVKKLTFRYTFLESI